jgi:hypothetical protein
LSSSKEIFKLTFFGQTTMGDFIIKLFTEVTYSAA